MLLTWWARGAMMAGTRLLGGSWRKGQHGGCRWPPLKMILPVEVDACYCEC